MTNTPNRDMLAALAYLDDISEFYNIVDGIIQSRLAGRTTDNVDDWSQFYESALAEAVRSVMQDEAPF